MMNRIINDNERILHQTKQLTAKVMMSVTSDTEGLIDTTSTSAKELDANMDLINNTVECEFIRRFGV